MNMRNLIPKAFLTAAILTWSLLEMYSGYVGDGVLDVIVLITFYGLPPIILFVLGWLLFKVGGIIISTLNSASDKKANMEENSLVMKLATDLLAADESRRLQPEDAVRKAYEIVQTMKEVLNRKSEW